MTVALMSYNVELWGWGNGGKTQKKTDVKVETSGQRLFNQKGILFINSSISKNF